MLKLLNKNFRRLCSHLRRNCRSNNSNPKIIIKKLGKPTSEINDHYQQKPSHSPKCSAVYPNNQNQSTTNKPIRVATFNAALFSMAPAVVEPNSKNFDEDFTKFRRKMHEKTTTNSFNDHHPKSILKQSPLHHTNIGQKQTSNNNANNFQETLTRQQKFAKSRLRVSINLPDNEISLGRSRRIDETRSVSSLSERSNRAIVDVLRELDADIIALQEIKAEEGKEMKPLSDLAAALGMHYVFAESWAPEYGNAVLSKWPIMKCKVQKIFDDTDFRNVLKTTIDVPDVGELNFYCTHLDHLDESWRMKQINSIIQSNNEPHILAGGLNSLDESDYSLERWTDIVKYYEDMGKPTPKAEVMRFLKHKQYTDAKEFSGECESVVIIAKGQGVQGTCKYGTRVDYILGSPGLEYKFVPGSYSVFSSKGTSDHHIVKVDIIKVDQSIIQDNVATKKKDHQPKKRVVKITNSSSTKGIWSTDMR